jgi:hypothetical protein
MQPEDILLIGVGLVVVLNRGFTSTSLRLRRWAYVVLQGVNLVAVVLLFSNRLEGYPHRMELAIRVFLTFFVAWHMVLASQARAAALREVVEEDRIRHARQAARRAALADLAAAQESAAAPGPDESPP